MEFPIYRRYKNEKSYFKILDEHTFIEYKVNINRLESHHFEAKILPERNYIQDMLYDYEPHWEVIDEATFKAFLESHKF